MDAESGVVDLEPAAYGGRDELQVGRVGADHEVVAAQRTFDYAGVDDVGCLRLSCERPSRTGAYVVETLDTAPGQQPCQLSLAAGSSPGLRNDSCRSGRHFSAREQGAMASPHPAFALVGCD